MQDFKGEKKEQLLNSWFNVCSITGKSSTLKGAWDSETHFHFSETGERRERGLDTRREVKPLHPSQAGQPSLSLSFSLPVCPSRPSQGLHGATKENERQSLAAHPSAVESQILPINLI